MEEYENLLNRAIDQLPPEVFEHKRFKIPKAYSDIQGNRTFIKNFKDVAEDLNRDPHHVLKFLLSNSIFSLVSNFKWSKSSWKNSISSEIPVEKRFLSIFSLYMSEFIFP